MPAFILNKYSAVTFLHAKKTTSTELSMCSIKYDQYIIVSCYSGTSY
jgi:hypothetical protein